MARAFRPAGGAYVAELDEAEARLLAQLAADVLEMLDTRAELTGDLVPDDAVPDDGAPGRRPGGAEGSAAGAGGTVGPDAASEAPNAPSAAGHETGPEDAPREERPAQDETPWWEQLGLSPADLGVGPDGDLLPDNAGPAAGDGAPGAGTRRRARPSDPALARLLPDLVAPGDAADGEAERLRALTEPGIVAAKRANLAEAERLLRRDPLRVAAEAAPRFASALNDIRLVLAQRLGIESEADADRVLRSGEDEEDEVLHYLGRLYDFVTWLQETLMTALLRRKH